MFIWVPYCLRLGSEVNMFLCMYHHQNWGAHVGDGHQSIFIGIHVPIRIPILMGWMTIPHVYIYIYIIIEGSLEVKLPTTWTNEKQRWEESEKRREEERRSTKRKSQKKEYPGARKGRKVAKHIQ